VSARAARPAFVPVVSLFFAWGFLSANNDPLVAALRQIFHLSYTEALFTHLVSFVAFGLLSLPAAALLARFGSIRTILVALAAVVAGCLIIQATRFVPHYPLVLAGLFVAAGGVTTLQVAANPVAAAAGPPEQSHFRLTLAQFFNALGVVCGVHFGAALILGGRLEDLEDVQRAFLILAGAFLVLATFILVARRGIVAAAAGAPTNGAGVTGLRAALGSPWALFGTAAIALYVGAEVSVGSMMINFLAAPERLGISFAEAGFLLANVYWGGALVGRFFGALLMIRFPASRLLAVAAVAAATLCLLVLVSRGAVAAYSALAIGLFNAIMFPTIFTLTLERAGATPAATSGLLCLGIAFGAPLPLFAAAIADLQGVASAFAVPLLAYLFVAAFAGICASRPPRAAAEGCTDGRGAPLPVSDPGL
jgi:MFS transporter, FHS family, L-fucose permease